LLPAFVVALQPAPPLPVATTFVVELGVVVVVTLVKEEEASDEFVTGTPAIPFMYSQVPRKKLTGKSCTDTVP
jgi:hypothetical protein